MALSFIAIDPETDSDHGPAVFVEEGTGTCCSRAGPSLTRRHWPK
jgi:hypothetical protein